MNGNDSIFPMPEDWGYVDPDSRGLNVRTWLVGQILSGLISRHLNPFSKEGQDEIAMKATRFADTVLEQLYKKGTT